MHSSDAGLAVEGVEAVVRTEQHPPVVLLSLQALSEHLRSDSAGEVMRLRLRSKDGTGPCQLAASAAATMERASSLAFSLIMARA